MQFGPPTLPITHQIDKKSVHVEIKFSCNFPYTAHNNFERQFISIQVSPLSLPAVPTDKARAVPLVTVSILHAWRVFREFTFLEYTARPKDYSTCRPNNRKRDRHDLWNGSIRTNRAPFCPAKFRQLQVCDGGRRRCSTVQLPTYASLSKKSGTLKTNHLMIVLSDTLSGSLSLEQRAAIIKYLYFYTTTHNAPSHQNQYCVQNRQSNATQFLVPPRQ